MMVMAKNSPSPSSNMKPEDTVSITIYYAKRRIGTLSSRIPLKEDDIETIAYILKEKLRRISDPNRFKEQEKRRAKLVKDARMAFIKAMRGVPGYTMEVDQQGEGLLKVEDKIFAKVRFSEGIASLETPSGIVILLNRRKGDVEGIVY